MDFIELIGNLVEFAQNDDEFPDEVTSLMATLKSLQSIMENNSEHKLPQHIIHLLDDDLPDAKSLIEKVRKKSNSFWNRVMNLFPWSDLNKIKEKNQKLLKIINILNLHLSSRQKFKRSSTVAQPARDFPEPGPTKRLKTMSSGDTQARELTSSTAATDADSLRRFNSIDHQRTLSISSLQDNTEELPHDGDLAFRLKLVCDPSFADTIKGIPETQSIMKRFWNDQGKAVLSFRRLNLANDFKALEAQRLSKEHAKITSSRSLLLSNTPQQENNDSKVQNGAMEIETPKKDENNTTSNNNSTENKEEDGKMIEEQPKQDKPKNQYEYSFRLKDTSLNGTYYLKGFHIEGESGIGTHVSGDFQRLKKNDEVTLEHGDIIGLILEKPNFQRLTFGYQFLTE